MRSGGSVGGFDVNATTARLSASLARYQPKISDVIFKSLPLFEHFQAGKQTQDGGLEIAVHFEYGKVAGVDASGGSKGFGYYEELNVTPSDNIKTATCPWKSIATPCVISWKETRENASPNRFNLWKQKVNNAVMSAKDEVNELLWGISGGLASLIPYSLPDIITGSGLGSSDTVYGLLKSSNTWMYSQEESAIGEFADYGVKKLRSLHDKCAENSPSSQDAPTLYMTSRTPFEAYEDVLPPQFRTDSLVKGDIGFQQLFFKGTPMRYDRMCPTDADGNYQILAINNKYVKAVFDTQGQFKVWPMTWMGPRNYFWATQIITMFNVICTNFESQGIGYGIKVSD